MPAIFLFGTLRHPPLLAAVAGAALAAEPAHLPGARVVRAPGGTWPMLLRDPGAGAADAPGVAGLLIRPDAQALARLDYYEACFDYLRRPLRVVQGGGALDAEAWFPALPGDADADTPGDWSPEDWSQEDWLLEDWARDWGAISVRAAAEVLRGLGREPARDVGRRFGIIRARAEAWIRADAWQRPGLVGTGFGRGDVSEVETRALHDGFLSLAEITAGHARFDGGRQPPAPRSVVRIADAVTVLPYDPVRDRILLIEQFRFGAHAHGDAAPWLLEPIAGLIDAGEEIEATARREAREEARLDLGALHFVARYYPTPGGVAQVLFSYLAIADLPDGIAGLAGHAGEGEDIRSHLVPYDVALRLLEGGDMANAPLIVTMQYLMLNRDRLRAAALPPAG